MTEQNMSLWDGTEAPAWYLDREVFEAHTDRPPADAAADLRNAARYIDEHGWSKYEMEDPNGGVCALGGIAKATGYTGVLRTPAVPRYVAAQAALLTFLNKDRVNPSDQIGFVPSWNDEEAADQAEVPATLEKAAAWIEEQA